MSTYPFVQSKWDYGKRKGPALGLMFHMAEGGGTVHYLSKAGGVQRGVSVHTVCDERGIVTQMLPWDHASGSLNPQDRSTDKAFFGHQHLVDVLGTWWQDPNSAVLSMEIEGFALKGPNPAQVLGAVAWGIDMIARFPSLRGALGHADQTDTKRCPGATPAMRQVFDGVGGHGLWHPQSAPQQPGGEMPTIVSRKAAMVDLEVGDQLFDAAGRPLVPVSRKQTQLSPWAETFDGGTYRLVGVETGGKDTPALIHSTQANTHEVTVPPGGFDQAYVDQRIAAARERQHEVDVEALNRAPTIE